MIGLQNNTQSIRVARPGFLAGTTLLARTNPVRDLFHENRRWPTRSRWVLAFGPWLALAVASQTGAAFGQDAAKGAANVPVPPVPDTAGQTPPIIDRVPIEAPTPGPEDVGIPAPSTVTEPRVIDTRPNQPGEPRALPGRPETPTIIPVEPEALPSRRSDPPSKFVRLNRDVTGLVPDRPPGPAELPSEEETTKKLESLIDRIQDPEAEISVAIGQTKLIETKRSLTRIAVSNPLVADVDVLADQPDTKLVNLYGRSFGTTTVTLWDAERPVTFLVRVTLDAADLENRVKQTFPGAEVHIRQVGPQVILEGQVRDAKTMNDVLQLVTNELRNGARPGGAAAGGGGGGGAAQGGGMGGGGMGGGGGTGGGAGGAQGPGSPYVIVNRVHVPGPRQVLLRVKIAELNRTAIREMGISWLNTRNNAILGSTIG
ncbi:MAG: pilus assembly protein N-terminal domain-containing protein, partial [Isosphaeraceae bacterium]